MLVSKRKLKMTLAGVFMVFLILAVWGKYYYFPVLDTIEEAKIAAKDLEDTIAMLEQKKGRLERLKKITGEKRKELEKLSGLMVEGASVQEVNASTQAILQKFWQDIGIELTAYKEVSPVDWRGNRVGRVVYQFTCGLETLASLLQYLGEIEKVIRVEALGIHIVNRKRSDLKVSLTVGTLFIENVKI